ncbi:MAG: carbohydrate ABC transporter permease [Bdellovibrionales bacterium]|nr:carbohydrate ABC transporter permease [Bdellovibrionales bacterium]
MHRILRDRRLWITLLLLVPALIQFFPILYMVSLSFKQGVEVFAFPPTVFPKSLKLNNYDAALKAAPVGRFLVNSLIQATSITLLQVFTAILAAYALARTEFPGKKFFLVIILATMMVPGEVIIIPNYLTLAKLGWLDTYAGLVVPFGASGFGVFLLYQFFKSIPKELEEAARVDGASRLRFLFQIMVPLSMPAVVAFAVYAFVSAWNQYLWPLVVTQSTEMQTAQIGIGMFRAENEANSWGMIMAATTLLIAPSIALFLATQKQFVQGITMSGLKG